MQVDFAITFEFSKCSADKHMVLGINTPEEKKNDLVTANYYDRHQVKLSYASRNIRNDVSEKCKTFLFR